MIFIYDRTQDDVNKVKELNEKLQLGTITDEELVEWRTNLKGAINRADLERLLSNMIQLALELHVELITNSIPEIPTVSWYTVFLQDITKIKEAYMVHSGTPGIPIQPLNTFEKWNIIEKNLFDIDDILSHRLIYHCGNELISGDDILI